MKKILMLSSWIIGVGLLLLGTIGVFKIYEDYYYFWSAKNANPDLLILTRFGGLYDKSWIAFDKASAISLIGIFLMYQSDKRRKLTNGKMLIKKNVYIVLSLIFLSIAIYFTFLDTNYSFIDKMTDRSIENLIKEKNERK